MKGNFFWKSIYTGWEKPERVSAPGYTLLLMVPGDLPVFLQIAMEICALQNAGRRIETVVVPDNISPALLELFKDLKSRWKNGPIRMARLNPFEYFVTRTMNNPHTNCWLQFIRGCNEASTTHLLWHDADLFMTQPDFLENHYQKCAEGGLACLGASQAWDEWYRQNNYGHLVSTWELVLDLKWVRDFKPWQHRGHDGTIHGQMHTFDITFLPQCLTEPSRIRLAAEEAQGFVHFNYVIGTYRKFQNSRGSFEDNGFKLLLVRLLAEAYDRSGWKYEVPSLPLLAAGLKDPSQRVTFLDPTARTGYPAFRKKLQDLMECGLLNQERKKIIQDGVSPFDEAFSWKQT